jgi:hypothetical protein
MQANARRVRCRETPFAGPQAFGCQRYLSDPGLRDKVVVVTLVMVWAVIVAWPRRFSGEYRGTGVAVAGSPSQGGSR